MYGQRFRRAASNIGLDDLGLEDLGIDSLRDDIRSSTSTHNNFDPTMLIAMAGLTPVGVGGFAIGHSLDNKSQQETKTQQLAQMKYM